MKRLEDIVRDRCTEFAQQLQQQNKLGTFSVDLKFSLDLAPNSTGAKVTVEMAHYHYSKFSPTEEVKGVFFEETFNELQRRLGRDDTLHALPKPRRVAEPKVEEDEVPF